MEKAVPHCPSKLSLLGSPRVMSYILLSLIYRLNIVDERDTQDGRATYNEFVWSEKVSEDYMDPCETVLYRELTDQEAKISR